MKNKLVKVLCLGMSAAMIFTMPGCNMNQKTNTVEVTEKSSEVIETENPYLGSLGDEAEPDDGDTLYVISDATGKTEKLIKSTKVVKQGEELYEHIARLCIHILLPGKLLPGKKVKIRGFFGCDAASDLLIGNCIEDSLAIRKPRLSSLQNINDNVCV